MIWITFLIVIAISFIAGFRFREITLAEDKKNADKALRNQLSQVQGQNMRYLHEIRILNRKYRRARLLNKKFQKERDVLKNHVGLDVAMPIIKTLYPEGNLSYLNGE